MVYIMLSIAFGSSAGRDMCARTFCSYFVTINFSTETLTEIVQNDRSDRVGLGIHHEVLSWFKHT
jgi:hypothetical protein